MSRHASTPPTLREHAYAHAPALATSLAEALAARLRAAIETRGRALLALSGGNTPRRMLAALSEQVLDWTRVTVTLVDERWVAADDPRSNERLLRDSLLRGAAAAARFVALYRPGLPPEAALPAIASELAALSLPFDAVVLGLGLDGHCASWFPDADTLAAALDPDSTARALVVHAASVPEPRVTLTLAAVLATRGLVLHLEGEAKRQLLARAAAEYEHGALPVHALLRHARIPIEVYCCP